MTNCKRNYTSKKWEARLLEQWKELIAQRNNRTSVSWNDLVLVAVSQWGMQVYSWAQISTPQDKTFLPMGPKSLVNQIAKNASSSPAFPNLWLLLTLADGCHGTNKYFTAQTHILTAWTLNVHGTNNYSHSKNKYYHGKNKMFTAQAQNFRGGS